MTPGDCPGAIYMYMILIFKHLFPDDLQELKVYKVHMNDDPGLSLIYLQQGQILSKLLIVLQTNSHVSVYRTIGPLGPYIKC